MADCFVARGVGSVDKKVTLTGSVGLSCSEWTNLGHSTKN